MIGVAILDQDPMIRSLLETHVKKVEGYEIIGSMESIDAGDRRNISGLDCKTARRKSSIRFYRYYKRYFLRNFLRYETVRRDRLYLEALYICEISRGIDAI